MYIYTNVNFPLIIEYMEKEKHNLLKVRNVSFVFFFSIFPYWHATNVFIEYNRLQNTSKQIETYIQLDSWKYCQNYHIVEPNNMLPNFGNQKIGFVNNCICQKGRYFVPIVMPHFIIYYVLDKLCIFFFLIFVYFKLTSIKLVYYTK